MAAGSVWSRLRNTAFLIRTFLGERGFVRSVKIEWGCRAVNTRSGRRGSLPSLCPVPDGGPWDHRVLGIRIADALLRRLDSKTHTRHPVPARSSQLATIYTTGLTVC